MARIDTGRREVRTVQSAWAMALWAAAFVLSLTLTGTRCLAQPAADECADAPIVTLGGPGQWSIIDIDMTTMTVNPFTDFDGGCATGLITGTAYLKVVPACSRLTVSFASPQGGSNPGLLGAVYQSPSPGSPACATIGIPPIACLQFGDNWTGASTSDPGNNIHWYAEEYVVTPGQELTIRVARAPIGAATRAVVGLMCSAPVGVADVCDQAVALTPNSGPVNANNSSATVSAGDPQISCRIGGPAQGFGTIWFTFVADNERARVSTCADNSLGRDPMLMVFRGAACNALSFVGCNDDAGCGVDGYQSEVIFDTIRGERYFVELASHSTGTRGAHALTLTTWLQGDTCGGLAAARELDCGEVVNLVDARATGSSSDPEPSCVPNGPDTWSMWFRFTPTTDCITLSNCNSGSESTGPSVLTVYEVGSASNPCSSLTEIGCSGGVCGENNVLAHLELSGLTAGREYYARVDGYNYFFSLELTCRPCGDTCTNCPEIPCGGQRDVDNREATSEPGEQVSCWAGDLRKTMWFNFVATGPTAIVDTCSSGGAGAGIDTVVGVFSSPNLEFPCGNVTQIGCNDNACALGMSSVNLNSLTPGQRYFILLGNKVDSDAGSFVLRVRCPPANDTCAGATPLSCGQTLYVDTSDATGPDLNADPIMSCRGQSSVQAGNVWLRFTPWAPSALITTCMSTGGDSELALYEVNGTYCQQFPPYSLTEIACSEDAGCGPGGRMSTLSVNGLTPGILYVVQLASRTDADRGVYTISAQCVLSPPPPPVVIGDGFEVKYYALNDPQALPNFESLTPYDEDTVQAIDFPASSGNFATSGRADHVGATFQGLANITITGLYTISLTSDDGSMLIVNDEPTIFNDGLHGMTTRSAEVFLVSGHHSIEVHYFERTGEAGLVLLYNGPDTGGAWNPLTVVHSEVPPPNDDCAGALPIQAETFIAGTITNAAWELPESSCGLSGPSVWYRFDPPCAGQYAIQTEGSSFDPFVSVIDASCGSGVEIFCNNDGGSFHDPQESYAQGFLTNEHPCYIRVASANGVTGDFFVMVRNITHEGPYATITAQPTSQTICQGETATFSCAAAGVDPISYQWRKNGEGMLEQPGEAEGVNSPTLRIINAQQFDQGTYDCVVIGPCGNTDSQQATLSLRFPPIVVSGPMDQTTCPGSTVVLTASGVGEGPLTYQWRRDGGTISDQPGQVQGVHTPTLTVFNIQSDSIYGCDISNNCGTASTDSAYISVEGDEPTITVHPAPQSACQGQTAVFSVGATGPGPFSYRWRRNGVDMNDAPGLVSGATTAVLSLSNVPPGGASYSCAVTNGCGTTESNAAALSVLLTTVFGTHPQSQTACTGANVNFIAAVGGSGVTYQWRHDGVPIPGANSFIYSINGVNASHTGTYDLVATGTCNTAISNPATLALASALAFSAQPQAVTACEGATVQFTVAVSGTDPAYQWRFNGSPIGGATGPVLTVSNVSAGSVGLYSCQVTNPCGPISSNNAALNVSPAYQVTTQPQAQTVCAGPAASASFTFGVSGGGANRTNQWRKDGIIIPGATGTTYSIFSVNASHAGVYDCVVSSDCGSISSNPATLTVNVPITITQQPVSVNGCEGQPVSFSVTATGTVSSYQWRRASVNIVGANGPTYTIASPIGADAATYDCVLNGPCGNVMSTLANLAVRAATVITTQPVSQHVCAGSNIQFTCLGTGFAPLTRQWRRDGAAIPGQTGLQIVLNGVQPSDNGTYDCVLTGACGSVASDPATLQVETAPTIVSHPPPLTDVCRNGPATFSVTVSGIGPFSYQWQIGLANIPGATGSSYTIPVVTSAELGYYRCIVTGLCGSATSAQSFLRAFDPIVITGQPLSSPACLGGQALFSVFDNSGGSAAYQWRRNGAPIDGATSQVLTWEPVTPADDGAEFDCVLTNSCGPVTSQIATLTTLAPVMITSQPTPQTVCAGASTTFTVTATGDGSPTYRWRRNGVNLFNGANYSNVFGSSLSVLNATAAQAGAYSCVVTGPCGAVESSSADLVVNPVTVITQQPVSQTVCVGAYATFTVAATGGAPLTYQWRQRSGPDARPIQGATGPSYSVQVSAVGLFDFFDVVVTGICGSVISVPVDATGIAVPTFSVQPVGGTVCRGGIFSLSALLNGATGYQWRRDGVDIPSAIGPFYDITGAGSNSSGGYTCVAATQCGPVVSNTATVTVCVGDFNCSGSTTSQDIFDFLGAFFGGCIGNPPPAGAPCNGRSADINGSGSISSQDIFDFLAAFFSPCN